MKSVDANKKGKRTKKLCPECGESNLEVTEHKKMINGVEYIEKCVECPVCFYKPDGSAYKRHKTERLPEL